MNIIFSFLGLIEKIVGYTILLSVKIFKRKSNKIKFKKRKTKLLCDRRESKNVVSMDSL